MARVLGRSIAAIILSACLTATGAHEHAVIPLNSENFEHATQAATGQTTGFWFVYFGGEDASADQQMWRQFAEQQREDKPWLLHAFVNVDAYPDLAERFKIRSTPAFILFRDRKMYRFGADYVKKIEPAMIDALTDFSGRGWRRASAEKVPPDAHVTRGFRGFAFVLVIVGAVVLLVLVAVIGQSLSSYHDAATPTEARRTKGQ